MPDTDDADPARTVLRDRSAQWLAAVGRRHSRRAFDGQPADSARLDALDECCRAFRPYPGARVELIRSLSADIFTGIVGSYGKVTGAPHALAVIADENDDFSDQHAGYTGEGLILEATRLGLDTCWVGGAFSPVRVRNLLRLAPGERVYGVSPVGHAKPSKSLTEVALGRMAHSAKRKCVADIAPGISRDWPTWAVAAVETARLAPSAVNRQPWRFSLDGEALVIAADNPLQTPRVAKRLDCGIAMLHAELGAAASGVRGRWTDLASPRVARFDAMPTG